MTSSLQSISFRNHAVAELNFRSISERLSNQSTLMLSVLLRQSPNPDTALSHLKRFLESVDAKRESFTPYGNRLAVLIEIFGNSDFLAETLLHHPKLLPWALDERRLYRVLSTETMRSELGALSFETTDTGAAHILARCKRMHLLRIAIRDIMNFGSLAEITEELSNLADAILTSGQEYIRQQLLQRFGRPLTEHPSEPIESHFVVLALGKLGGCELNYSSDIDLMYLYTAESRTSGKQKISGKDFFSQLAQRLTRMLSQITPEGFCFRVDLRLRPEGRSGELVLSTQSAMKYYTSRARDWELQMLIKARVAAGNHAAGNKFLEMIEPLIYRTTTNFSTIEQVTKTRDRIQKRLITHGKRGINVKLDRGGIRDIEFLVQCLQRLYGGHEKWVRNKGTLLSLHRLRDKNYLSTQDYSCLHAAYCYLRTVEHRLQIEHNRQVHTLPLDMESQSTLARKISRNPTPSAHNLTSEVIHHFKKVSGVYNRVINGQSPIKNISSQGALLRENSLPTEHSDDPSWAAQIKHLQKQSPRLAKAITNSPIRWNQKHFKHFLNNFISSPKLVETYEKYPEIMSCISDLIEHSPYLAEQIIRHPNDITALKTLVGGHADIKTILSTPNILNKNMGLSDSTTFLRHYYRCQMLTLLAKSIYLKAPIFSTLNSISHLADVVIQLALQIAIVETERTLRQPQPPEKLQIVALGRLGMREFNLGSDADLVFVLPDKGKSQVHWWNRVIEILVEIVSNHTSDGRMFTVDSRLRPMGRDGELIQTESRFKEYFSKQAAPWEAITYMKARTIAGDLNRGTQFLSELQNVDWKRYGASGELASELILMRSKIEETYGMTSPIKAGQGGYYDIDFILMYLRLQNAGIFFPSLNTPERIAVLRTSKTLNHEQADTLEMAAKFLSSLEHAVRITIGPSATKIPASPSQRNIIGDLVKRWSESSANSSDLEENFEVVRRKTRELFMQIFH